MVVVVGDDGGHSLVRLVQSCGSKYKHATRLRDYVIPLPACGSILISAIKYMSMPWD